MGSSNSMNDNANCITNAELKCGPREYVQYNDKGNIAYYFKPRRDFIRHIIIVYDMYQKEIGSIERLMGCALLTYNFYDELLNTQIPKSIKDRRKSSWKESIFKFICKNS